MELFDFLKRKKEAETRALTKSARPSTQIKSLSALESQKSKQEKLNPAVLTTESKKNNQKFSYGVVREPHISEKSTNLSQENKYVFKVYSNTSKPEIKKSVQGIYGVDVIAVNIIKIPKKKRRLGRTEGFKKGFIKAIVTLKEGQKIEVY